MFPWKNPTKNVWTWLFKVNCERELKRHASGLSMSEKNCCCGTGFSGKEARGECQKKKIVVRVIEVTMTIITTYCN